MSTEHEQLLLFEEPLDVKVKNELKKLKDSNDRSRKAQFAKIGDVRKRCDDLEQRLQAIERGLCQSALHPNASCEIVPLKQPEVKDAYTNLSSGFSPPDNWLYLFSQPSAY